MGKKLVVSFPGGRTGTDVPILYFCAKSFENRGYEKLFIPHAPSADEGFATNLAHAKEILANIDFSKYEDIVFVAKSRGTQIACMLKQELHIPAALVLLTPIPETLPYITKDNHIIFVSAGTKDRYLDSTTLQDLCEQEHISYYIEQNVGHRMEVAGNIDRDVEIIGNVTRALEVELVI